MEDGYKNREVMSRRYESALNILTDAERNEYLRDGHITVQEPVDLWTRREVEERRSTRHETREHDLESILHAEFFACDTASDGVPLTHFLHMDYGLISIIRFSDNTLLIYCYDENTAIEYYKDLYNKYECEIVSGLIRVFLEKPQDPNWKINLLKEKLK